MHKECCKFKNFGKMEQTKKTPRIVTVLQRAYEKIEFVQGIYRKTSGQKFVQQTNCYTMTNIFCSKI